MKKNPNLEVTMLQRFSSALDWLSNFLAHRKGLLPLIAILMIILNFILVTAGNSWLSQTNFFLHLGIILAILGFMFAWAL